ncbi:hypothetical protein, partial [Pediococcus acidilactici]|uniref:hypothetical protein n=1 Tax=Pediococcus acidilactici TaxID=1254 RepID=UPI001981AB1B
VVVAPICQEGKINFTFFKENFSFFLVEVSSKLEGSWTIKVVINTPANVNIPKTINPSRTWLRNKAPITLNPLLPKARPRPP